MELVIWKFPLEITRKQVILTHNCKVLSVAFQDDKLCLWAIVDTDSSKESVQLEILIFGTGIPIEYFDNNIHQHIGTVQDSNGLVWHVFFKLAYVWDKV